MTILKTFYTAIILHEGIHYKQIHTDVLYLIQYLYPRKVEIDASRVMAGVIVLLNDCKNAAVCSCFLSMFRTSAQ
jgi:hypothetical protein